MAQTMNFLLQISGTKTPATPPDLGSSVYTLAHTSQFTLAEGTGLNQANQVFPDERTLTTGQSEDLDLNGVLINPLGEQVNLVKVKAVVIVADATNTTNLTIGNAASNQFVGWFGAAAHTITLKPGGVFFISDPSAAGYPVTAGTGDLLRVTNAPGATAKYKVIIIGATV